MQKRTEPETRNHKQTLNQTFFTLPVKHQALTKTTYKLDLQAIIADKADSEWHGRVGAYSDEKFQLLSETKITGTEKRIPFKVYFTSLVEHINSAERTKYCLMKNMIAIISEVYGAVSVSPTQHNEFCNELLFQINAAMSTSADSFDQLHNNIGRFVKETPVSMVCQYWAGLKSKFNLEEEKTLAYTALFNQLITCFEQVFLAKEKTNQIMKHYISRDIKLDACVSWFYISVLCDANDLDEKKLAVFKNDYQQTCFGLASELVYLPDMWEFLLHANHQEINSSKDSLSDIDKILKKQKGLLDCRPQEQNTLVTSLSKMLI